MKKHHTQYLVATSEGRWGRGDDLQTALKNAIALNKAETKLKKGISVFTYINIQLEEDRLTQERIEALASDRHCQVTGYNVGEFMAPWIDNYGSPHYYGILEELNVGILLK
jgi:hypothetical protein